MIHSRREWLYSGLLLPAAGGMLSAAAQEKSPNAAKPPWSSKVSPAIVSALQTTAADVYRGRRAHRLRSADLRRFSTTFAIFAAHLEEIGAVPDIESSFKTSGILEAPAGREQLAKLRSRGAQKGFPVGDAQFERFVGEYVQGWPPFVSEFQKGGLATLNATLVSAFEDMADRVLQYHNGTMISGLRLLPATFPRCETVNEINAVSAVYLSTWGIMLMAEVISIPFFGWAIAGASMMMAVAGMFCA